MKKVLILLSVCFMMNKNSFAQTENAEALPASITNELWTYSWGGQGPAIVYSSEFVFMDSNVVTHWSWFSGNGYYLSFTKGKYHYDPAKRQIIFTDWEVPKVQVPSALNPLLFSVIEMKDTLLSCKMNNEDKIYLLERKTGIDPEEYTKG